MALPPNSATASWAASQAGLPRIELPNGKLIEKPHRTYMRQVMRWRFLGDSLEGGEVYRQAVYGLDVRGMPIRNLIRHKREYPAPMPEGGQYPIQTGRPDGTDMAAQATDDDYEMRRARTPVPTLYPSAIEGHLSKIYSQEVVRDGPDPLKRWWKDVDGKGASIDQWMDEFVAPLFLAYGQLDILIDHPAIPADEQVRSRADELRLGLDSAVAHVILPENVPWWRAGMRDEYLEAIVREPQDDATVQFRYWDATSWTLYDDQGKRVGETTPHPFGRVPIIRLFDRQRPKSPFVGKPRYEAIAEIQRDIYNRASELVLSDTTQAFPLLQGPEDYVQADGTIPIGPNWLLPKKKNTGGTGATYEGFDVIDFPKGAAESIRQNIADGIDAADRAACMTKPAGAAGTNGQTVAQSGTSKRLDHHDGNKLLGKISKVLQRAEERIADLALVVLGNGTLPSPPKPTGEEVGESPEPLVKIRYPTSFDLYTADDLAKAIIDFQSILESAGKLPETEGDLICKLVRLLLPGCDDEEYEEFDAEIAAYLEKRSGEIEQAKEADALDPDQPGKPGENQPPGPPVEPDDDEEDE